jgi:hypothetical protein
MKIPSLENVVWTLATVAGMATGVYALYTLTHWLPLQ